MASTSSAGNAALEHQPRRLRHGQRIGHAPVGARVDEDALGAVAARDLHHALVAHLGVRIEREGGPEAAVEHVLHRLFVVVVDDHARRVPVPCSIAISMLRMVPVFLSRCGVWTMHHHVQLLGQLQLRAVVLVLGRGLVVDSRSRRRATTPSFTEIARQHVHHLLGQRLVVRLLAVEPDGAVVADAELGGAEALPADQARQIVDVAARLGARLAEPERRLDDGDDAGRGHALVVVGGARAHVDVRVDESHGSLRVIESSVARGREPFPGQL